MSLIMRLKIGDCRLQIGVATLVALIAASAAAAPLGDDLVARRGRVMDTLGPDAMLILWSAPVARYSNDVDYPYRQDSNLYYLTGVTQPDTMLILMPGNETRREILFVKDRNPAQEHWSGRFEPFVTAMLSRRGYGAVNEKQAARFFDALSSARGRLALVLEPDRGVDDPLTPPLEFARQIRDRFVGFAIADARRAVSDLRIVKTQYERDVLARTAAISKEAHLAGMQATRPGAYEYQVKAAIEAVHYGRGGAPGYPSIVGSGPNATILHYPEGGRQMQGGDLLLVDAASTLDYLTVDITRTYPVGGTFSPAQKEIYEIVLQAQLEGIRAAKPGASLQDVHRTTVEVVKAGLLKLGLITDASGDQYRTWYTHGASHYIGIDVHDVGQTSQPLEAGMAFTIEPGLYIRQSALDSLPRTAENAAFIEKVRPMVQKYADIGIRIEDSFILEESGLRNLSEDLPKTIADIEAFLRRRPQQQQ
jgi:Xaa-Pro aminopeptidase